MTLQETMITFGITSPAEIIPDEQIHRFKSHEKSKGKDGWYVLFDNGIFQVGRFGCWKLGISENYLSISENKLTPKQKKQLAEQKVQINKKSSEERIKQQEIAKHKSQERFNNASTDNVDKHQYLIRKRAKEGYLRLERGLLLMPMYHNDELVNIQTIDKNGNKYFSKGGQVQGAYHLIGKPENKIIVCEGYTTGASIHEATGKCVAIACNAGNLPHSAKHLRQLHPNCDFLIAGDDDQFNDKNTGKDNAIKAANAINCDYVLPKFEDKDLTNKPTDFNDLHHLYGLEKVKEQIKNLAVSPIEDGLDEVSLFVKDKEKPNQTTILTKIAQTNCQLFHDSNNDTFANIRINNHNEIWQINSRGFKEWLNKSYYELTSQGASSIAIDNSLNTISANAKHNGPKKEVYLRVAQTDNKIYLDICDDDWQVVEVDENGFRVLEKSPVAFIRKNGMLPLPTPKNSSNISLLKKHLNIKDKDFYLVVAWILMSLQNGKGAYPILILQGEQGTAKSTTAKMLRALIDPNKASIRVQPNKDNLINMANNNYLSALDNLSGIHHSISDTLCCFSTGAGQSQRKLYTDREDDTVNIKRPILLNGIDDIATRGDLASRSILIELPTITNTKRKDETTLWKGFNSDLPRMFGALLNGLVSGLANIEHTKIDNLPRMADFAKWGIATTQVYGWGDDFINTYQTNIKIFNNNAIENSPFSMGIIRMANSHKKWQGTATELLNELEAHISHNVFHSKKWITTPRGVSNQLARFTPALKEIGILVERIRSNGRNLIKIELAEGRINDFIDDCPFDNL